MLCLPVLSILLMVGAARFQRNQIIQHSGYQLTEQILSHHLERVSIWNSGSNIPLFFLLGTFFSYQPILQRKINIIKI
jgi:hypothetical protein